MEMNKTEVIKEQTAYIEEALEFLKIAPEDRLEFKVEFVEIDLDHYAINWKLRTKDLDLAGSYPLKDAMTAKMGVVMAVGMIQHRYGVYIYQVIMLIDMFMSDDPERNNLFEIILRSIIYNALDELPASQIKQAIMKRFDWDKNLKIAQEMYTFDKAKKNVMEKKNGNKLN